MIDLAKLKELIALMAENDLSQLELKDEHQTVSLKRGSTQPVQVMHAAPAPVHAAVPAVAPQPVAAAPAPAAPAANADADLIAVESPMVGTFYASPNPDSAAFVTAGSSISPDTVVCLIEAMKVFNEIKAEKSGKVERVLVKNGQAVEFGQKLFLLKP